MYRVSHKEKDQMKYFDTENNFLTVNAYNANIEEIIDSLNIHISRHDCEKLSIDISILNLLEATKVGAICSTHRFAKYPFGCIEWIVKDIETKNMLKTLSMRTTKTSIKRPIIRDFATPSKAKVVAIR